MGFKITHENAGEHIDVIEALDASFGTVTQDGVLIDRQFDRWGAMTVNYSLPETPEAPFRSMDASEYAAEFYKACGGLSLDEVDFKKVQKYVTQCEYVGEWLACSEIHLRHWLDYDGLRSLQTAKPEEDTRSLSELAGSARCMDDDARRIF